MELNKKISADYIQAMKDKDVIKKTLLGTIKGELQTLSKNSGVDFLSDNETTKVLQKTLKGMKQTLSDYEKINRNDTGDILEEIRIIESYLPKLMGENEVRAMISKFITEGANNIGMIMAKFKGMEVDNKMVSQIAKELL